MALTWYHIAYAWQVTRRLCARTGSKVRALRLT